MYTVIFASNIINTVIIQYLAELLLGYHMLLITPTQFPAAKFIPELNMFSFCLMHIL